MNARFWRLVLVPVALAVVACLAAIAWSGYGQAVYGQAIPMRDPLVVGLLFLPVAVLSGMQPRPRFYRLGLLCLLVAFLGTWLAGSGGDWVARNVFHDAAPDPYSGQRRFGYMVLLFPVAWILLARSVSSWKIALASYLAPGLAWACTVVTANWASGTFWVNGVSFWVQAFPVFLVLWPSYMLGFLDLFGLHFFD